MTTLQATLLFASGYACCAAVFFAELAGWTHRATIISGLVSAGALIGAVLI